MTREEVLAITNKALYYDKPNGKDDKWAEKAVNHLVDLGILKLDEPKSPLEGFWFNTSSGTSLITRTGAVSIEDQLMLKGYKIVKV